MIGMDWTSYSNAVLQRFQSVPGTNFPVLTPLGITCATLDHDNRRFRFSVGSTEVLFYPDVEVGGWWLTVAVNGRTLLEQRYYFATELPPALVAQQLFGLSLQKLYQSI